LIVFEVQFGNYKQYLEKKKGAPYETVLRSRKVNSFISKRCYFQGIYNSYTFFTVSSIWKMWTFRGLSSSCMEEA